MTAHTLNPSLSLASINMPTFGGVAFVGLTHMLSLWVQGKPLPKNIRFFGTFSSHDHFETWKETGEFLSKNHQSFNSNQPESLKKTDEFKYNTPVDSKPRLSKSDAVLSFQKGRTTMEVEVQKLDQILDNLGSKNPKTINHFFSLLSPVLAGSFRAAREDYEAGLLKDGYFAASRISGAPGALQRTRRITALAGLDQDNPKVVHKVFLALVLLGHITLFLEKKQISSKKKRHQQKAKKEHTVIDGLVQMTSQVETFKGEQIGQGDHRGGKWKVARIHPEAFKLFKTRFTQVPLAAIKTLRPKDLNVYLAAKSQMACKGARAITMDTKRLIADAGLEQPHISGCATEKKRLGAALEKIQNLEHMSYVLDDDAQKVHLSVEPVHSKKVPPAACSFKILPVMGPAFLKMLFSNHEENQRLKSDRAAVVKTLERSVRGETPPDTSLGEPPKEEKMVATLE